MKNNKIFSLLAIFLLFAMVSCSEKEDQDTPPDLPPVDALMMDFSEFIDNPANQSALKSMNTYQNALYSYATVAIWNIVATAPMIIPVAAYLESFKHTPVYLGENSWQWSYSVNAGMDTYTARLVTKRISNEEFKADMFITRVGVYEDFKWFEGTVRYDRTHAEWTMYESALNNVKWLNIEWNKDWELDVSDITYTIVKAGGPENGSFIEFGIVDDETYDAYYSISYSQKETFIEWNLSSKVGRVKDMVTFGDADWHCWNEVFLDVDCN
ncbi:hypothetical protein ACFLTU_01040 [Bacteroidota bacterium]